MLRSLSCPEDSPIACSIRDLTEAVSEDPSTVELFALVGIPSIAALLTLSALVVSLVIANQAKKQSDRSEIARKKSEDDRLETDRKQRFTAALGDALGEIPGYLAARKKYAHDLALYKVNPRQAQGMRSPLPLAPSVSGLIVRLANADLNANPDESELIRQIRDVVNMGGDVGDDARRRRVAAIPDLVVHWVQGQEADKTRVIHTLEKLARAKDIDLIRKVLREYADSRGTQRDPGEADPEMSTPLS